MKGVTYYVKLFDAFSQLVMFRTSRSQRNFGSVIGALFTTMILVFTMPYFVDKFNILVEHGD